MSDRNTQNLDQWSTPDTVAPAPAPVAKAPEFTPPKLELVEINYPEPTPLSVVVRDVARWSGQSFVMEPSVNTKIQIFAPRRLSTGEAYELFLASLSIVNLRAVQLGKIVKIVPITLVVAAYLASTRQFRFAQDLAKLWAVVPTCRIAWAAND